MKSAGKATANEGVEISGADGKALRSYTLENAGVGTWSGTGIISGYHGAKIHNTELGSINILDGVTFVSVTTLQPAMG